MSEGLARAQRGALCFALLTGCAAAGAAGGWTIEPSIFVGVNYSDNVELVSSNTRSGTSYDVIPRLVLSREGPRFQTSTDYQLQTRFSSDVASGTQTFHFLNFDANVDVVEDLFGVALGSQVTQQASNPLERTSLSTRSSTILNVTEVATATVEPYFTTSIGANSLVRLSYRVGVLENGAPLLRDSLEQRGSATVRFASPTNPLSWTLAFSDTNLEYDTGREIQLRRGSVDLGWRITPQAELVLNFGEDVNDLGTLPSQGDFDGFFWLAGLRGTLGSNTSYEARVGEQFFGDSYLLQFTRQQRRLTIDLSYTEETSTRSGLQLDYESLLNFLNNVGGFDLPTDTQDVFINKRLNLATSYQLARSSWRLSLFNEDRSYVSLLQGSGSDSVRGAGLDWTWEESARNTVNVGLTWQAFEVRNSLETPEGLTAILSLNRRLTPQATASLRVIASDRSGSRGSGNFSENALTLGLDYEF